MRIEAVKERLECGVFGALRDTRDLGASWLIVIPNEVLCDLHACVLLFSTGLGALPDVDSVVKLKDIRVRVIQVSSGEWSFSDLSCHD